MIITFKEAPELGRVKVVKDGQLPWFENGCQDCVLQDRDDICNKTPCVSHEVHFERVKQND